MTSEEIQQYAKQLDAISEAFLAEIPPMWERLKLVSDAAKKAVDDYFQNIKARKRVLAEQEEALNASREELEAYIAQKKLQLIDATVSGDGAALTRIQEKLTDLEAERSACVTQVEILGAAVVPGDKSLYEAALEAEAILQEEIVASNELIHMIEDAQRNLRYDEWKNRIKYFGAGAVPDYQLNKMRKHFAECRTTA